MAIRIEMHKPFLQRAIEAYIQSLKRQAKAQNNPAIQQLLEKDIAECTHALNTISEVK